MVKSTIIPALCAALILFLPLPSRAGDTCSNFTQPPSGNARANCTSCSNWGAGNANSTFQCTSCPGGSSTTSLDISTCGSCRINYDSSNGTLECDEVVIAFNVSVTYTNPQSSNDPEDYHWSWTYAHSAATSTAIVNSQYSLGSNGSVDIKNGVKAKVIYTFTTLPTGWQVPTGVSALAPENPISFTSSQSAKTVTITDNGASNQTAGFRLVIEKGNDSITSPDPTVVNKGSTE